MTKYIDDGFESGTYWDWGGNVGWSTGTISIVTNPVHSGSYALQVGLPSSNPSDTRGWVAFNSATPISDVYFRAFMYFPDIKLNTQIEVLRICDNDAAGQVSAYVAKDGVGTRISLGYPNGSTVSYANTLQSKYQNIATDTWHYIELRRKIGSGNAVATLYFDGVETLTVTYDTIVNGAAYFILGDIVGQASVNNTPFFVDDAVVADSYIGTGTAPTPPPPPPSTTIIFSDGFESGEYWANWNGNIGYNTGALNIVSTHSHSGNYALKCGPTITSEPRAIVMKQFQSSSDVYLTAAFYFTNYPTLGQQYNILRLNDSDATGEVDAMFGTLPNGSHYWALRRPYGSLIPYGGDQEYVTAEISLNRWYIVTIRRKTGNGDAIASLFVDGVQLLTGTNDIILNSATDAFIGLIFTSESPGAAVFYVDDVEINTTSTVSTGTLNVTATLNGSPIAASVSVGSLTGTTPATFTLTPSNYTVTANYAGTTLTQQATITANQTTTVNFSFTSQVTTGYLSVVAYAGSTTIAANVSVNGQTGTTPATFTFPPGTYSITATYQGTALPAQTVTIVAGQTSMVTLQFPELVTTVTLTVVAGTGGTVYPAGVFELTPGSAYQFTEIPAAGYNFDHWDLAGTNKGSSPSIILTPTTAMDGQTLTAIFTLIPPPTIQMTIASAGNGSTDIQGPQTFNVGDTVTITAIPQVGETFTGWKLNGASYTGSNPLELTVTSDLDGAVLTAEFTGATPPIPNPDSTTGAIVLLVGAAVLALS